MNICCTVHEGAVFPTLNMQWVMTLYLLLTERQRLMQPYPMTTRGLRIPYVLSTCSIDSFRCIFLFEDSCLSTVSIPMYPTEIIQCQLNANIAPTRGAKTHKSCENRLISTLTFFETVRPVSSLHNYDSIWDKVQHFFGNVKTIFSFCTNLWSQAQEHHPGNFSGICCGICTSE